MKDIIAVGFSEKGLLREMNQDSLLIHTGKINGKNVGLFLVADGIGGLENGEEASKRVAEEFDQWWKISMPNQAEQHLNENSSDMNWAAQGFLSMLQALHSEMLNESSKKNIQSGTTLSLLFIINDTYCVVHVGDSRIYRIGSFFITRLTEDHNLATEKYKAGKITKSQWKNFEEKNPLVQCIGAGEQLNPQILSGKIRKKDDRFLLCTDGVYKFVPEKILLKLVRDLTLNTHEKALDEIRRHAYSSGAADNLTGILVHCIS